ncbi:MAG: hypothetical protein KDB22_07110 [Planctomycetales bacterium]|nr:hypothetical protein [Planctomycetales bacterium]
MNIHKLKPRRVTIIYAVLTCLFAPAAKSVAQCACGQPAGGIVWGDAMMLPPGVAGQIIEGDAIYLTVNVPEAAIVQVNGDPTISIGPTRYFVVKNLDPERTYKFEIVVETANPAGVPMEASETVKLKPGNTEVVSITPTKRKVAKPAQPAEASETGNTARRLPAPRVLPVTIARSS